MHRQASFIPTFFPEGTVVGEDVDFFYFPAYADKDLGKPVLGAGTLFVHHQGQPGGARAFIEFLETPIAHEIWMAQSGFLTPLQDGRTLDAYGERRRCSKMGEILLDATTFRFDGSDLMPGGDRRGRLLDRHGRLRRPASRRRSTWPTKIQESWDAT